MSEYIQVFITAGADVFAKDNHDKTALHYAAQSGAVETMQALITMGLDKY